MKQRLVSAGIGIALLVGLMFVFDSFAVPIVFNSIALIAVYECWRAFKPGSVCHLIIAGLFLITVVNILSSNFFAVTAIYLISVSAAACLDCKGDDRFNQVSSMVFMTLIISFGFRSMMLTRLMFTDYGDKVFLFIISLCVGWICDTFAYIFGRAFGKRKLSPFISPNKTVEGAVYGVLSTTALVTVVFVAYEKIFSSSFSLGTTGLSLLLYFGTGFFGAVVGIFGDLIASYAKRQCGIKDFGNIMPGHGGAMDRIDSVMFTAMFMYIVVLLFFG